MGECASEGVSKCLRLRCAKNVQGFTFRGREVRISDFRLRCSGVGFTVWKFEFGSWAVGLMVWGLRLSERLPTKEWRSRFQIAFACQGISGFRYQVSCFRFQVSGFRVQVSGSRFRFQDSGLPIRGAASRILGPAGFHDPLVAHIKAPNRSIIP